MPSHPYLRAVAVLLLALVSTCVFALFLWALLPKSLGADSLPVGLALYAVVVFVFARSLRYLAGALLFEKRDRAPLQMVGGVRLGTFTQAMATGRGATWPFAKLSASRDEIRVQTPFGRYSWRRADLQMDLRQTMTKNLAIGADAEAILFVPLPWRKGRLARSLRELGYDLPTRR